MAAPPPSRGEDYFNHRIRAIRERINEILRPSNVGEFRGSFACISDIQRIWAEPSLPGHLVGDRLTELFGHELDRAQLDLLREKALPLLSYAVKIRVGWTWFRDLPGRAFPTLHDGGSTVSPQIPLELPLELPVLERLLGEGEKLSREDYAQQFWFAPVSLSLSDDAEPQRVSVGHMLPLQTQEDGPRKEEGSYGHVYFCRLSPEYIEAKPYDDQIFRPDKPYAVAVKMFNKVEDSKVEVETLKCLKKIAKNHPISLHHSIVQYGDGSPPQSLVIFPFAGLGNLQQFLTSLQAVGSVDGVFRHLDFDSRFPALLPSPTVASSFGGTVDLRGALLEQCLALAGALRFLHGGIDHRDKIYLLAHMDLKPDNIVICAGGSASPVGIWKIADFGISVIRTHDLAATGEGPAGGAEVGPGPAGAGGRWPSAFAPTINTTVKRGPSTYTAPEIAVNDYHDEEEVLVGRKSDIWSFGAIFAEVLAFARGRTKHVLQFRDSRCGPTGPTSKIKSDFYWQRTPSLSLEAPNLYPGPAGGSSGSSRGQDSAGDSSLYDREFTLRPGVTQWLDTWRRVDPVYDAWVECIRSTLQVNPYRRPQADTLFILIREVLYPPPPRRRPAQIPVADRRQSDTDSQHSPLRVPLPRPVISSPESHATQSHSRADSLRSASLATSSSSGASTAPSTGFSRLRKLTTGRIDVPRDAKAVAVDRRRIVYLTKEELHVYHIQPTTVGNDVVSLAYSISLASDAARRKLWPGGAKDVWMGVGLAGDYLACYGKSASNASMLRVFRLVEQDSPEVIFGKDVLTLISNFDYTARVAVSPMGLIALVKPSEVVVLDASHPGRTVARASVSMKLSFNDVAFSDDGSFLYASGWGMACSIQAFRVAFVPDPTSTGGGSSSEVDESLQLVLVDVGNAFFQPKEETIRQFNDGTRVLPLGNELGCLVATPQYSRVLACVGLDRGSRAIRPLVSTDLVESKIRTMCVPGSRLLMTVEREGGGPCLVEYMLGEVPTGPTTAMAAAILVKPATGSTPVGLGAGSRTPFLQLGKQPDATAELRAFTYAEAGAALVLVCHLSGKMEAIKFSLGGAPTGAEEGTDAGGRRYYAQAPRYS